MDAYGENSSGVCKGSSELSANQQDSAYSSLIHSAYNSLNPVGTPATSTGTPCTVKSTTSMSQNRDTTSKSSGSSNTSCTQSHLPQMTSHMSTEQDKKEQSDRAILYAKDKRKRKPKLALSLTNKEIIVEKASSSFANSKESKAAKVATLSQALGYVDQFRKTQASKDERSRRGPNESDLNDLAVNLLRASQGAALQGILTNVSAESEDLELGEDIIRMKETGERNGFCVAVSMHDGMVMQTTASIKNVLGYPKDMWVGRNFIDFVHPQDRDTFINQVTENLGQILRDMHSTPGQGGKKDTHCKSGSFFSRIRIYNGLRSGFSVKERKTRFAPFKLSVCFSEKDCKSSTHSPDSSMNTGLAGTLGTYLFITAIPLISAFTQPYEDWTNRKEDGPQGVFVTKHNSNHILSNIEESVIPYLGFLPQDMNGKDLFSFVHPDDQSTLKEVFNNAMLEHERPCKSKYIRLRVRNTGFVYLNSWWSFFINPWSRQLEFVHGKHTVKKGPRHPDVFAEVIENVSETEVNDSRPLQPSQADINNAKKIVSKLSFADASSKTRRDLSSFMITLLEEMAKSETKNLGNLNKIGAAVIGNISPHQSDSSESPPSYNQLTYNENLTRFFNSQPKTLTDKEISDNTSAPQSKASEEGSSTPGSKNYKKKNSDDYKKKGSEEDMVRSAQGSGASGEQAQTVSGSGEENGKNSSTLQTGLSAGHVQSGREDCMLSMDGSGSGSRYGSGSRGASVDNYTPPELTSDLLERHNKEMEAKMLCKYKESKKTGEIRFIRDQKYEIAQQEAIKRLGIQKAHAVNLQLELNKMKRLVADKQAKQAQSSSTQAPKGGQGMKSSSIWRQYGGARGAGIEDGQGPSGQPGSDATKIKHAHEGFVGFNQANMMERGTPANLTGFPNLVVDPAYYMAFNSNNVGQHKVQLMQSSLMMHAGNTAYMGLDQNTNSYHRRGEGQTGESRSSASKIIMPKSCKRQRSPNHEPELQNCLAVSSCMVCQPDAGCSGQAGAKCNKKLNRPHSRIDSRAGSRATSIKGEPGSALESNASASVDKEKKMSQVMGLSKIIDQDHICLSTSSSSLYSFLKTSDDYNFTNLNSTDEESRVLVKCHVAKPVLSEPFWNEKVVLNNDLVYTFQMEVRDTETVLKEDMMKLSITKQYKEVSDQLMEANCPLDLAYTLVDDRSSISSENTTDASDDEETDQDYLISKHLKKKDHLEKLNMFMGADAPFPLQESGNPVRATVQQDSKMYSTPVYSSKSSECASEQSKSTTKNMRERSEGATPSLSDGSDDKPKNWENQETVLKNKKENKDTEDNNDKIKDKTGDQNKVVKHAVTEKNKRDKLSEDDSNHESSIADISMPSVNSPNQPTTDKTNAIIDDRKDKDDCKTADCVKSTSGQVSVIKHAPVNVENREATLVKVENRDSTPVSVKSASSNPDSSMELSSPDANKDNLNDADDEQSGELSEENHQAKASMESSSDDNTEHIEEVDGSHQENKEYSTENKEANENITEAAKNNDDNSEDKAVVEGPEAELQSTAVVEGPELQPTAEPKVSEGESDNSDL